MTFGIGALEQGIDFVPVAMGLFGIAEVLESAEKKINETQAVIAVRLRDLFPNRTEIKRSVGPIGRGAVLGFLVGLIPGPAAVISTFCSYILERKLSPHPEEFGKGAPEGVSGPESANNAAAVGAFVPVLSLGIPFAPPTALLLTAMMIHGITPGPLLVQEHPEVFWGVIASMYIGNVMLLALNLPLVGLFVQVLRVPPRFLMPNVLLLCVIGAYAVNNSLTDLYLMGASGILGYVLRKLDFPIAPLVLALVIGPMLEDSFRQSLMMSLTDDYSIFLASPLSKSLCLLAAVLLTGPYLWRHVCRRKNT
jgi:putative tricarboxylic transport membrane protein